MSCVHAAAETDKSFVQIANADIEELIKQLTLDEKVSLLTGMPATQSFLNMIES